jgi:hypothetical protein
MVIRTRVEKHCISLSYLKSLNKLTKTSIIMAMFP